MQFFQVNSKTPSCHGIKNLILISCFACTIYFLYPFILVPNSNFLDYSFVSSHDQQFDLSSPITLQNVVFGIASNSKSWSKRKEYVKLWWKPNEMRGCVFLEKNLPNSTTTTNDSVPLPPICISEDISRFPYTNKGGSPSAIRVARVVSETVALNLNHSDVKWFVFGDDDTIFFQENLVKTLSKYDNGLWYYIGSNSESFIQNKFFSFDMAFGGAGFAISYPLAKILARVFDSCIERYPHLYGSDGRIHACLTELGVTLTHEPGFHQMDFLGNAFGLLAAHPIRPLVSLHHMEKIDPIFPNMTRMKSLEHLYHVANFDPQRILQQTVCYDRRFSWTVSVSWGYVVQVFEHNVQLPDAQRVQESYLPWKKNAYGTLYEFNIRKFELDPCKRQLVYFLDEVSLGVDGIKTIYKKKAYENCTITKNSPRKLDEIRVFSHKLEHDKKQLVAPRRRCCDILPSTSDKVMEIGIRKCKEDELIYMHN
ncbi:hypothetical protein R3W88_032336 [Solanum pinnatisectum]|uniref:Uncharacterized protein n=1 Tax=Solanum pinnatisectum TaxID=50273 RepID=A0AAV9LNW4_9SOLN|nr:hypothetical protein R3W88_032336 [Solanum pinnatisectum]